MCGRVCAFTFFSLCLCWKKKRVAIAIAVALSIMKTKSRNCMHIWCLSFRVVTVLLFNIVGCNFRLFFGSVCKNRYRWMLVFRMECMDAHPPYMYNNEDQLQTVTEYHHINKSLVFIWVEKIHSFCSKQRDFVSKNAIDLLAMLFLYNRISSQHASKADPISWIAHTHTNANAHTTSWATNHCKSTIVIFSILFTESQKKTRDNHYFDKARSKSRSKWTKKKFDHQNKRP